MIPHMDTSRLKFNRCIPVIMAIEGGLVHNTADPKGLTKYGISQRSYPELDIAHLAQADAEDIYFRDFWTYIKCGELPDGLDLSVLDFGINAGPLNAEITMQRLVGIVQYQPIGPETLHAIATCGISNKALVDRYAQARMRFYQYLQSWRTFGSGWTSRVERIRTASLAMVVDPCVP